MAIAEHLAAIRDRIDHAARQAGRNPADVTLIAVSKRQPDEAVAAAVQAGQRDFAENLVQPWVARSEGFPGARWHLIGPVQTNKARLVWTYRPTLLHTLDRERLIEALERRQQLQPGPPLPGLVEVNLDGEAQKAGVSPGLLDAFVDRVVASPVVELRGLMCIPKPGPEGAPFARLRQLAEEVSDRLPPSYELSMGMSGDFERAIAQGATMVRVGTAIFGARR